MTIMMLVMIIISPANFLKRRRKNDYILGARAAILCLSATKAALTLNQRPSRSKYKMMRIVDDGKWQMSLLR